MNSVGDAIETLMTTMFQSRYNHIVIYFNTKPICNNLIITVRTDEIVYCYRLSTSLPKDRVATEASCSCTHKANYY